MFDEKIINLVISQTNYDRNTSLEKLELWEGDHIKVIKDYLNPNFQKEKKCKKLTTNQRMMSSIRGFMDDVYKGYDERKKQAENIKLMKEFEIKKRETLKRKLEFINEIDEESGNIIISEITNSS